MRIGSFHMKTAGTFYRSQSLSRKGRKMNSKKANVALKLCVFCLSLTALAGFQAQAQAQSFGQLTKEQEAKMAANQRAQRAKDAEAAAAAETAAKAAASRAAANPVASAPLGAEAKWQAFLLAKYIKCTSIATSSIHVSGDRSGRSAIQNSTAALNQCDVNFINSLN
jgi:cytoskeletal protein RodZ